MSSEAAPARVSRRELVESLTRREETISKYETRLRDVVRAYKGVVKEKEALEVSTASLSRSISLSLSLSLSISIRQTHTLSLSRSISLYLSL
jgi:predicted RNase H-like nuclease (RuvC/YqgF family)